MLRLPLLALLAGISVLSPFAISAEKFDREFDRDKGDFRATIQPYSKSGKQILKKYVAVKDGKLTYSEKPYTWTFMCYSKKFNRFYLAIEGTKGWSKETDRRFLCSKLRPNNRQISNLYFNAKGESPHIWRIGGEGFHKLITTQPKTTNDDYYFSDFGIRIGGIRKGGRYFRIIRKY